MSYRITVQNAQAKDCIPSTKELQHWAKTTLQKETPAAEVTLRIVSQEEIQQLNFTYRKKNKPTNVLSFPAQLPDGVKLKTPFLGDIIICAEIVNKEAQEQNKSEKAHWAHMVVHGNLHLLGYDHENDHDAEIMEKKEVNILGELGFANPYHFEKGKIV